ncbi:hypothetical protein GE09DRAFT_1069309 [Coniochaeta sp. 2T2.1]|nr:hypothetical protein GE09DRAFT_1069309 [Coniochaeta sp. 2T2.1]
MASSPASTPSQQVHATPQTAQYHHPPTNSPAFMRISVRDLDRSQAFYSAVFGWRFMQPQPNFPRIFFTGGEVMGGLHLHNHAGIDTDSGDGAEDGTSRQRQTVVNFVLVDDVEETLEKARQNGGRVLVEKFTEGDHTELAEFEFEGVVMGVLRWLKS